VVAVVVAVVVHLEVCHGAVLEEKNGGVVRRMLSQFFRLSKQFLLERDCTERTRENRPRQSSHHRAPAHRLS